MTAVPAKLLRHSAPAACVFVCLLVALTGPAHALQPYNMPVGATEISRKVFDLHMLIYWICVAIGVVVYGFMLVAIVKHRKSVGHKASQFHESVTAEMLWTIVPLIILIGMAIPSSKVLIEMENTSEADLSVKITGYQWLWHYDYIGEDVSFYSRLATSQDEIHNRAEKNEHYLLEVDKELVLPVGKKIRFLVTANDVLHSWWVPDLAVKKDAIPGFINEVWTRIDKPGVYRGQCTELCGRGHGFMPIVVRAVEPEQYAQWLAEQSPEQSVAAGS